MKTSWLVSDKKKKKKAGMRKLIRNVNTTSMLLSKYVTKSSLLVDISCSKSHARRVVIAFVPQSVWGMNSSVIPCYSPDQVLVLISSTRYCLPAFKTHQNDIRKIFLPLNCPSNFKPWARYLEKTIKLWLPSRRCDEITRTLSGVIFLRHNNLQPGRQ